MKSIIVANQRYVGTVRQGQNGKLRVLSAGETHLRVCVESSYANELWSIEKFLLLPEVEKTNDRRE